MVNPSVRFLDVILRRPLPPEDERERKGRQTETQQVKSDVTLARIDRLLTAWRHRA